MQDFRMSNPMFTRHDSQKAKIVKKTKNVMNGIQNEDLIKLNIRNWENLATRQKKLKKDNFKSPGLTGPIELITVIT